MNMAQPSVIWIATLAAVVATVVLLREILLPFVAAIALAYLLDPIVDWFERKGVNRSVAGLGLITLFYLGLAGALAMAIPVVGSELATLVDKLPESIGQLEALAADPKRPWLRKRRIARSRAVGGAACHDGLRLDSKLAALGVVGQPGIDISFLPSRRHANHHFLLA
jgi:predicted PurR-regulated permease PerM